MRFSLRIFLGFFLLIGLMAAVVFDVLRDEIRPVMRQSAEDVLVDVSQLLAELVRDDVIAGRIDQGSFSAALARLSARNPAARIRDIDKQSVELRVYVTDNHGRVLFDSAGNDVGADYSQWRDVYLTLHGLYGARTSRADPANPLSTWMYVAAPVVSDGKVVGVLSVGKPTSAIYPYIARAEQRLLRGGVLVFVAAALLGALFSWWLSRAIGRLTAYARAVRDGERVPPPSFVANRELAALAGALEEMRTSLDGKEYVEEYVLGLTHELKSPLAGISASAELLHDELPAADRLRFADHVSVEATRLREIVDRLLELVRLEQRKVPAAQEAVPVAQILSTVRNALLPQAGATPIVINAVSPDLVVHGERFLLEQAIRNLVQNALDFALPGTPVRLSAAVHGGQVVIAVDNEGEPVPNWALPRLFDRFYSVPRAGGHKGSGLGLPLVRSIATLHGGSASVANTATGVRAVLVLPQT